MNIMIHLIFMSLNAFACPELTGTYTCTSSKGESDTVYIKTFESNQYSILNENALNPIMLVANNETQSSQEFVTDDHGKVIGWIVKNTLAHCPSTESLHFEVDTNTVYYGQKIHQLLQATVQRTSLNQFVTTTKIITTEKDQKTETNSQSKCVLQ